MKCDHCHKKIEGRRVWYAGYCPYNLQGTYCESCASVLKFDRYGKPLDPAAFTYFMLTHKRRKKDEQA